MSGRISILSVLRNDYIIHLRLSEKTNQNVTDTFGRAFFASRHNYLNLKKGFPDKTHSSEAGPEKTEKYSSVGRVSAAFSLSESYVM